MIEAKDVPSEVMAQIRETFDRDPQVVNLRIQQNLMQRQGHYRAALDIAKNIEYLYSRVVQEYLTQAEQEAERYDLANCGLPEKDIEQVNILAVSIFMACDIIDSCIMDINDTIHRTDDEMSFEMFGDLQQLSRLVKEKLRYLQENSGYAKDLVWGDKCDNMYDMIKSKAKSIIRKRKENPNWGKNNQS